ncbi:MAG: Na/Pi symporter [Chromatiales bacterium]|nr:Na/Pi symporter [Chromatiales bacterium]
MTTIDLGTGRSGARLTHLAKLGGIIAALYLFIVAIGAMAVAFSLFGREFAEAVLETTANPVLGLFLGLLATSLVQSSSTSTSIIVGMVAGGVISVEGAIPMIMGANIGTTVTSMLVSLGHYRRPQELQRGFAAAILHMSFNLLGVLILLPLELLTGLVSAAALWLGAAFQGVGGMALANPLKAATAPAVELLAWLCGQRPVPLLILAFVLTYGMLGVIVKLLRSLMLRRLEDIFDRHLFRTPLRALAFGLLITFAVQSSSIPTALAIPLAAAGVIKLAQIYPFSVGANLGTTLTAILAALATASPTAITVAFAHLLFNAAAILIIWPISWLRRLPLWLATRFGASVLVRPVLAPAFVFGLYFILPAVIVAVLHFTG